MKQLQLADITELDMVPSTDDKRRWQSIMEHHPRGDKQCCRQSHYGTKCCIQCHYRTITVWYYTVGRFYSFFFFLFVLFLLPDHLRPTNTCFTARWLETPGQQYNKMKQHKMEKMGSPEGNALILLSQHNSLFFWCVLIYLLLYFMKCDFFYSIWKPYISKL